MAKNALVEIKEGLDAHRDEIAKSLPDHISPERFMRSAWMVTKDTFGIGDADRSSIFNACARAAHDGLILDGREAALVVFKTKVGNSWIKKAQYIPMVAGIMKKVRQSGQILKLSAQVVYSKDPFTYNPAVDDVPQHDPEWFGDRGDPVGVYAVAKLKDGSHVVEIMRKSEIEAIKNRSKAKDNGPWVTDPMEMWRKTVIKRICKYLPTSADLEKTLDVDNEMYEDSIKPQEMMDVTPAGEVDSIEEQANPEKKPRKRRSKAAEKVVEAEPATVAEPPQTDAPEPDGDVVDADYEVMDDQPPI